MLQLKLPMAFANKVFVTSRLLVIRPVAPSRLIRPLLAVSLLPLAHSCAMSDAVAAPAAGGAGAAVVADAAASAAPAGASFPGESCRQLASHRRLRALRFIAEVCTHIVTSNVRL